MKPNIFATLIFLLTVFASCTGSNLIWKNVAPKDGNWQSWSNWSPCSIPCQLGITEEASRKRFRPCSPAQYEGEQLCSLMGETQTNETCPGLSLCSKPEWTTWDSWDKSWITCASSPVSNRRSRKCNLPEHGRLLTCTGNSVEQKEFHLDPCPVDGVWSAWPWPRCPKPCGSKYNISRSRECSSPDHNGIETCPAGNVESESASCGCAQSYIEEEGYWGYWGELAACQRPSVITGFNSKLDDGTQTADGDKAGLAALEFYCSDGEVIHGWSVPAPKGVWAASRTTCEQGYDGFAGTLSPQGGDDTSMICFKLRCSSDQSWHTSQCEAMDDSIGFQKTCPEGSKLCSVKQRYEAEKYESGENFDYTGLNGVNMGCC